MPTVSLQTRDGAPAVRRATPVDQDAIVALLGRLGRTTYLAGGAGCDQLIRCDAAHRAIVAVADDEIVGYGRWIRSSPTAPRADMAVVVAAGWGQRGIGTAVLSQLRREAHKAGINCLELRLARRPELIQELARHAIPAEGRFDDASVVLAFSVNGVIAGQERAALRWAVGAPRELVGPAIGEPAPRSRHQRAS